MGIRSRISLENAASLLDGDRDVVTSTLGSTIPDNAASATYANVSRDQSMFNITVTTERNWY